MLPNLSLILVSVIAFSILLFCVLHIQVVKLVHEFLCPYDVSSCMVFLCGPSLLLCLKLISLKVFRDECRIFPVIHGWTILFIHF